MNIEPSKTINRPLSGTGNRLQQVDATGLDSATETIITGKLANGTAIALLIDIANWDANGLYTGTAITGTFEGQYYSDANYSFYAYSDNVWIRTKLNTTIQLLKYIYNGSTSGDVIGDTRSSNQSGWYYLETCTGAHATRGSGTWVVTSAKRTISLVDNNESAGPTAGATIDLVISKSGYGTIVFGDGLGYATFIFTTAGVVTLINNSSNVFTAVQAGTNHVYFKTITSNTVRLLNELAATTIFTIEIKYTV